MVICKTAGKNVTICLGKPNCWTTKTDWFSSVLFSFFLFVESCKNSSVSSFFSLYFILLEKKKNDLFIWVGRVQIIWLYLICYWSGKGLFEKKKNLMLTQEKKKIRIRIKKKKKRSKSMEQIKLNGFYK